MKSRDYGIVRIALPVFILTLSAMAIVWAQTSNPVRSTMSTIDLPARLHYPVLIHEPTAPPAIETGQTDRHGQPIVANCSTCHATRPPNHALRDPAELRDFHQGLEMNHGGLTCLSCHNSKDYSQLRLVDDQSLPYSQVMALCAQCHGPQYRDYRNGSHGGMNGYWDLSRGPRARNNCIDCHDAHAPQYPQMMPVLQPNDRFLLPSASEVNHE